MPFLMKYSSNSHYPDVWQGAENRYKKKDEEIIFLRLEQSLFETSRILFKGSNVSFIMSFFRYRHPGGECGDKL